MTYFVSSATKNLAQFSSVCINGTETEFTDWSSEHTLFTGSVHKLTLHELTEHLLS